MAPNRSGGPTPHPRGAIVRWLVFDPGETPDPTSLSPAERTELGRLKHPGRRAQHIWSRRLLRAVLAEWGLSGDITKGLLGEPVLDGAPTVFLSIAHTEGLVAVALSRARAIGVDVERIDRFDGGHDHISARFHPQERDDLMDFVDEVNARRRALALWCLKEALAKATHMGLRLPLDATDFVIEEDGTPRLNSGPDGPWTLHLGQVTGGHPLAVAVRAHGVPIAIAERRPSDVGPSQNKD